MTSTTSGQYGNNDDSRDGLGQPSNANAKRLILGYDGNCSTCASIAQQVEREAGSGLEVLPLTNRDVFAARRAVYGDNPPHLPTLVEIAGDDVRAWTGKALGLALVRRLGPVKSYRIAQAVGEMRQSGGASGEGLPRSTFLKGALVAIAGAGVLATTPAAAALGSTGVGASNSDVERADDATSKRLCNEARETAEVQSLTARLKADGYTEAPEADAAVVGADVEAAFISFYRESDRRFAFIRQMTGATQRVEAQLVDLRGDRPVGEGMLVASGAQVRASDRNIIDCLLAICPSCAGGCVVLLPVYLQCLLDCCVAGAVVCTV